MKMLQMDVIGALGNLPEEQRCFLFGNPGYDEGMAWVLTVANYIVLEFIKYSFDNGRVVTFDKGGTISITTVPNNIDENLRRAYLDLWR